MSDAAILKTMDDLKKALQKGDHDEARKHFDKFNDILAEDAAVLSQRVWDDMLEKRNPIVVFGALSQLIRHVSAYLAGINDYAAKTAAGFNFDTGIVNRMIESLATDLLNMVNKKEASNVTKH